MNLLREIPNCAYYVGKFKTEGTLFLYDDRIAFDPGAGTGAFGIIGAVAETVFSNGKQHEIAMRDIVRVERHKVMGVNCCIKITVKNGSAHVYTLWPARKELDDIIDLIYTQQWLLLLCPYQMHSSVSSAAQPWARK